MRDLCRTCSRNLENTNGAINLYDGDKEVLRQINLLTGLWLEKEPNMPIFICMQCQCHLREAIFFREQCIQTQKYLKYQIDLLQNVTERESSNANNEEKFSPNEITPTVSVGERTTANEDTLNSDHQPANTECNQMQQTSTSRAKDVFHENYIKSIKKRRKKLTLGESKILKNIAPRKRKYICDKCSMRFYCPSNFKLHKLRHTGIKNFTCKTCDMKFYTNSLLRQHERSHIEPYKCTYCAQIFSRNSSKVRHERSHTNERPFKCRFCDNKFVDSTICKNHELVHTEEQRYHCPICVKWFRYSRYLKAHLATKAHKKMDEKFTAAKPPEVT